MGTLRVLAWAGLFFCGSLGASQSALAGDLARDCPLSLIPDGILEKHFRDFTGEAAIALSAREGAQAAAQSAFMKALSGDLAIRITDELDRPFQAAVSYAVQDGRAKAHFIGIAISPEAARRILRPYFDNHPRIVAHAGELDSRLLASWIDALAEMHQAIEFQEGRLASERLNSWDQEALARAWRGEPADPGAVAAKLWPETRAAHAAGDTSAALVNFGLARGENLSAAFHNLTPMKAGQLAADLVRQCENSQASALQRAQALADLAEGNARAAFMRLGDQAALLFTLEAIAEGSADPHLRHLIQRARTFYEQAYSDLERAMDVN